MIKQNYLTSRKYYSYPEKLLKLLYNLIVELRTNYKLKFGRQKLSADPIFTY